MVVPEKGAVWRRLTFRSPRARGNRRGDGASRRSWPCRTRGLRTIAAFGTIEKNATKTTRVRQKDRLLLMTEPMSAPTPRDRDRGRTPWRRVVLTAPSVHHNGKAVSHGLAVTDRSAGKTGHQRLIVETASTVQVARIEEKTGRGLRHAQLVFENASAG